MTSVLAISALKCYECFGSNSDSACWDDELVSSGIKDGDFVSVHLFHMVKLYLHL